MKKEPQAENLRYPKPNAVSITKFRGVTFLLVLEDNWEIDVCPEDNTLRQNERLIASFILELPINKADFAVGGATQSPGFGVGERLPFRGNDPLRGI